MDRAFNWEIKRKGKMMGDISGVMEGEYRCWVCGKLLEGIEQYKGICGHCERIEKQRDRQIRARAKRR